MFNKHSGVNFVVFLMLLFQDKPYDLNILWNIDTAEDDLSRHLKGETLWQTSGAMYKKSYFLSTTGFKEGLPFWQDYEMHTRLLINQPKYYKAFELPPDCFIRRHEGESISQKGLKSIDQLLARQKYYDDLIDTLLQSPYDYSRYYLDVVSYHYLQSINLLEGGSDLKNSLASWKRSRKLTSIYNYSVGCLSLYFKYRESLNDSAISRFLFRSIRYLMHPRIRKRHSKICRIKYESQ